MLNVGRVEFCNILIITEVALSTLLLFFLSFAFNFIRDEKIVIWTAFSVTMFSLQIFSHLYYCSLYPQKLALISPTTTVARSV
jgi:hypothetical protein